MEQNLNTLAKYQFLLQAAEKLCEQVYKINQEEDEISLQQLRNLTVADSII